MFREKIAHFENLEFLGEGGMAIVFKALDTRKGTTVALKVLPRRLLQDDEYKRRFQREASAGMRLHHPNIVKILEMGEADEEFFISMEYIEGATLRKLLLDGPVDPKRVIEIGISVCDGLNEAHKIGIIHRDIKSDNIMLNSEGDVKIMDFGLAKLQGASLLTQEGMVLGTTAYMSPEQAVGGNVDQRSDLFSLGVVFYELLTGTLPFAAEYELAVIYSIVNEEPTDVTELNKDVPKLLEQVVKKAMKKERQHRYQNIEELHGDLRKVKAFLEGDHALIATTPELLAAVELSKLEESALQVHLKERKGFQARLAGRGEQFETLKKLFSLSTSGKGQTIFITGEAGIGKTRLVLELEKYARTMKIKMLVGRCPFRQGVYPYHSFVEAIRDYFEVQGVKSGKMLEEFIRDKAPELTDQLPVIRVFLNIKEKEVKTIESKEQLWDAISKLIAKISQERPIILFIDDLHWADENTLNLLHYTSRTTRASRVMIVGTYRPEDIRATAPGKMHPLLEIQREMNREGILTIINLEKLTENDIQQMVCSIFQDSEFDNSFYGSMYRETEGNPFFVIETLKLLKMEGVIEKEDGGFHLREDYEQIAIPNTIHDIVMRRIERLNEEEREILEIGAVEGESFHSDTIGSSLGMDRIQLLRKLQSLERDHHIIYPKDRLYYFDHGKIREFLYDAVTPELRIEYHLMIGDYLANTYKEDERLAPNIARHFLEGEADQKAAPFLITAGERAKAIFANQQAIEFYEKALEIIRQAEEDEFRSEQLKGKDIVLKGLGDVLALTGRHDDALGNYHALQSILGASSPKQVELLWKLGSVHLSKGENDKASEFLDHAENEYEENLRSIKQEKQDPEFCEDDFDERELDTVLGKIKFSRSRIYKAAGNYQEAINEIEKGLNILEDKGNFKEKGQAYNDLGNILFDQSDYGQSTKMYMRSLDLRKKIADKKGVAETHINLANVHCEEGNYSKAAEMLEISNKLMIEIGYRLGIAGTYVNLGIVYHNLGRFDDSLKILQESLKISEEIGNTPILVLSYSNLGSVHIDLQNFDLAKEYLEKGLKLMDDTEFKVFESQALIWLGQALLGLGRISEAKKLELKAYKIAEELNQRSYMGFAKRVLGVIELRQLNTKRDTTTDQESWNKIELLLTESLKIFEELKMEHEFGRTCLELAKFYLQYGDEEATQNYKSRAKGIFEKLHALGDLEKVNKIN